MFNKCIKKYTCINLFSLKEFPNTHWGVCGTTEIEICVQADQTDSLV